MVTSEPAVRAMLSGICRQCSRSAARPRLSATTSRRLAESRAGSSWARTPAAAATAATATTASATAPKKTTLTVDSDLRVRWKQEGLAGVGSVGSVSGASRALSSSSTAKPPQQRRHSSSSAAEAKAETAASAAAAGNKPPPTKPILDADDLFHPMSQSPVEDMRRRAAFIKMHAQCPHPHHQQTQVTDQPMRLKALERLEYDEVGAAKLAPAHVDFTCPDCGVPVYCSEEHWMDDYEAHLQICDTLRQINEDDHDLRSGREFPEFEYPGPQMEEALVNMTNWDTFMYTRGFVAVNDDRSMRQVTRLLTYPVTVASVLHELSPYNIRRGGRMTGEGLKSFSALRYTLHPPRIGEADSMAGIRPQAPAVRLFVLGARAESSLPRDVWVQLAHLFPRSRLHVILIGPESMTNRDDEFPLPPRTPSNPFGAIVEDRVWQTMKISTIVDYYHNLHQTGYFAPYDPYFDCFVLFHPGLGHPSSAHEWQETIPMLLETKAPIIVTGYTQYDMERDIAYVNKTARGEFDLLIEPGENIFRSLRWDLNDLDPQDISCGNWGVWAMRGKRYEATRKDSEE